MIWTRGEFTIQTGEFNEYEGQKPLNPRTVEGSIIAGVGVYRTDQLRVLRGPGNPAMWRVCALGCGLAICDCLTEDDAKRIGEVFARKFSGALQERFKGLLRLSSNVKRVRCHIPQWVNEWVMACREKKAYVPWEGYQR